MINMSRDHFVRVGVLGHVGRFVAVDAVCFPRGTLVVCRTARGLEVGEVAGHATKSVSRGESDGSLLRAVSDVDRLWMQRLAKNRDSAFASCQRLLRQSSCRSLLIDVEHLFDGKSIYFYFLEPPSPAVEPLLHSLAEAYESEARIRDFTHAVEVGCGPGCGTEEAAGCGAACESCAAASSCKLSALGSHLG